MKTCPWALVATCFILPLNLLAVQPGDTRDAVIAELGAPTGSAGVGEKTILFFARGDVHLRDNRVVSVNLVSESDLAARQAAESAATERLEAATQARLVRLEAEGRAVLAGKKSDARFAALPAAEQLNYWRTFSARYSMVPVADQIEPLMERVEYDLRARELAAAHDARLAELENRVVAAEDQSARADREARRDRNYSSGYLYGGIRPTDSQPRYRPRHDDRTPVVNQPSTPPPQTSVDAARGRAVGEIEEARRRAYTGGN